MKQKNIHVVFGGAKRTLIDSREFDFKENQLVSLVDIPGIGPLCDLYSSEDIQKRKDWLLKIFETISSPDEALNIVDADIETIKIMIKHPERFDKIFLWTGYSASEMISTARLLYHLSKFNKEILIVNYPHIPVKSIHGKTIYPTMGFTEDVAGSVGLCSAVNKISARYAAFSAPRCLQG